MIENENVNEEIVEETTEEVIDTKEDVKEKVKEETVNPDDAEKNKVMAVIAYFIFFIPLLTEAKNSKFAMFHANQGLILLLASIVVTVVGGIIPVVGWFIILPFGSLFLLIVGIMGIINAIGGKMKKMPLIGGFHLIGNK